MTKFSASIIVAIMCIMFLTSTMAAAAPIKLNYRNDGTFKILQLTDIHMDADQGADYLAKYNQIVGSLLDAEKPDLVVITGDVIYWSGNTAPYYYDPALKPIIDRKIPWAVTLGNHDAESWVPGSQIFDYLVKQPYSLCQPGPKNLGADGNYTLEIYGKNGNKPENVLYLLNSHDHHPRYVNLKGDIAGQLDGAYCKPDYAALQQACGKDAREVYDLVASFDKDKMTAALKSYAEVKTKNGKVYKITRNEFIPMDSSGYDWIYLNQINWYSVQSAVYTRNNAGQPLPSLMFFHIPLPEYNTAWNTKAVGNRMEAECAPRYNSGLFTEMLERHDVMGVFAGHDHVNDYVGWLNGIALAYGRKTGTSVYGPYPMNNGGRVIVLHEGQRKFDTWTRAFDGKVENTITVPDYFN